MFSHDFCLQHLDIYDNYMPQRQKSLLGIIVLEFFSFFRTAWPVQSFPKWICTNFNDSLYATLN